MSNPTDRTTASTEPRVITPDGATDTEIIADAIAAFCRIAEEVKAQARTRPAA